MVADVVLLSGNNNNTRTVHFVTSWSPLLSGGGLTDCVHANDTSCVGGVAAVAAFLRHAVKQEKGASLVFQKLDKKHPFVQMHPLGWSVNRLIIHDMLGWKVLASGHSLLLQNKVDFKVSQRDISDLQTEQMPLLLTNVALSPANSWYPYTRGIYLDQDTGIALLSVVDAGNVVFEVPQLESTLGALNYIHRLNQEAGCTDSLYETVYNTTTKQCYVPVIYYEDLELLFEEFLQGVLAHEHPPALVIQTQGEEQAYLTPVKVTKHTWVVNYYLDSDVFYHFKLKIHKQIIENIELNTPEMEIMPEEYKDDLYSQHILTLRHFADQAANNNPIVGYSLKMPIARDDTTLRPCKAGECPIGNLFADALRWRAANADVGFVTSGGLRGSGWPLGPVRVSDIWAALPFPNTLCQGRLSGISLFKLLNYSMAVATFEGEDTEDGGRLVQVSGVQVTYNTQLEQSRVVDIQVWEEDRGYQPIEPLKLYTFATDSFLCGGYDPYPTLLGDSLVIDGEQPGVIGDDLVQTIVGDYLAQFTQVNPYDTNIQQRLQNDTSIQETLDLVQTADDCEAGTYWSQPKRQCLECPRAQVLFLEGQLQFEGESGSTLATSTGPSSSLVDSQQQQQQARNVLLNRNQNATMRILPKFVPRWVSLDSPNEQAHAALTNRDSARSIPIGPDQTLELTIRASPLEELPGAIHSTVTFAVIDDDQVAGCVSPDASFDVLFHVTPPPQLNQLGSTVRAAGWTLLAVSVVTAVLMALWVAWNRHLHVVKTMQPLFLVTLCVGVVIMASSIVPLSVDDEIASPQGCNMACMAQWWLLSLGFTISMSALFSKLWRINRLFGTSIRPEGSVIRRQTVTEKDVLAPSLVLVTVNLGLLLAWTLVDPMTWQRRPVVNGEAWNTYGSCVLGGTVSRVMMGLVLLVNLAALVLASIQAYKARKISDDFSESKHLGIALYSCVQVVLVGIPVLFLIDDDNPTARYFLQAALVFLIGMSLLLIIFVPMVWHYWRDKQQQQQQQQAEVGCAAATSGTLSESLRGGASQAQVESVLLSAASTHSHTRHHLGGDRSNHDSESHHDDGGGGSVCGQSVRSKTSVRSYNNTSRSKKNRKTSVSISHQLSGAKGRVYISGLDLDPSFYQQLESSTFSFATSNGQDAPPPQHSALTAKSNSSSTVVTDMSSFRQSLKHAIAAMDLEDEAAAEQGDLLLYDETKEASREFLASPPPTDQADAPAPAPKSNQSSPRTPKKSPVGRKQKVSEVASSSLPSLPMQSLSMMEQQQQHQQTGIQTNGSMDVV